jgi:hypothetical protein
MAKEMGEVKVLNAALEERGNGAIILRGSISLDSLKHLRTDDYQREILAPVGGAKSKLHRGVAAGVTLPDIELGMRGQRFASHGKTFTLEDPVYIIDGLQRVSAILAYREDNPESNTEPLGATVHFGTTKEWEKERFAALNMLRVPVSPNVLLRNVRDKHPSILTLYGLSTNDPDFALYRRVCWNQRMKKDELISASSITQVTRSLHRHVVDSLQMAGRNKRTNKTYTGAARVSNAPDQLDAIAKETGLHNFRANIKGFFDIVDDCYGIRAVEHNQVQGHLRRNFLMVLGSFLSENIQLWQDEKQTKLKVDAKTRARLRTFAIYDPEIRRLCSAGTMVIPTLYGYLLRHMNKGRHKHLFK